MVNNYPLPSVMGAQKPTLTKKKKNTLCHGCTDPYSHRRKHTPYAMGVQRPILTKKENYTPYAMGAQRPILTKKENYTPYAMGAQRPILTKKENYTPYAMGAQRPILTKKETYTPTSWVHRDPHSQRWKLSLHTSVVLVNWQVKTTKGYNPLLPRPVVAAARYCRGPFSLFYSLSFLRCVCVCVLHFFIIYINFYWRENLLHKEKGRPPAEVFATSAGIGTRNPVHWRQARRPVVVNLPGSFVRLSRYSTTMSKLVAAIAGCGNNGLRQQRAAAIADWPATKLPGWRWD